MKVFSERFKELRSDEGLSAKQLGKILEVSDSTIIRWENEDRIPSIEQLKKIAIYFKVSADYLIGLED